MAKLLIFRGEALHDERELSDRSLRIGRSPQNDIVLEDPSKGVSRNHAEIRYEGGRYTLVDLESQNGIWVAGSRVPSVVLEPGVTAAVGPFRLTVEAPAAVAEPVVPPPPVAEPATDFTQITEQPSAQPLVLDDLAPAPPEKPAPAPPEKPIAPARPKTPPAPKPSQGNARRPVWLAAAAAALLVLVSVVVAYTLMNRPDEPTWNREFVETLVASGACQEALQKHIGPELAANPDNAEARALRERCVSPPPPPPPTTTSVPVATLAERLDEADALIAANDCPKALEVVNAALAEEPENQRAAELLAKAKACGKPDPPPPPADPPAVRVAPSEGGLEPFPKETNKNYRARIDAMRKRYEDGVAALERGSYQTAEKIFSDVSSEVPEGYLDLAQRRDAVRAAVRAQAKNSFDTAQAAENSGDFEGAIKAYRRAHELDPSLQIDAPLQRINDRKIALGRKRCEEGKVLFANFNNQGAAAAFQDVLKLLPSSDPCYAHAREQLKVMGK